MLVMARNKTLRFDSFWRLQLVGWGCFYVWALLGSSSDLVRHPGTLREITVSMWYQFLVSFAMRPVCRRLLERSQSWLAFEWKAGVACVFAAILSLFVTERTLHGFEQIDWFSLTSLAMNYWFVLFMWCNLYFSIKQWHQVAWEKERLLRAETDAQEARLRALRFQLNPHFLFNSLNAVSTLVLDGNAIAANRMLAQIGDLLRTSLDSEVRTEVALHQEIAFTEQYLAIEQTRLGDRLRSEMTIPSETLDALVPSMLLQPLVENAVRHGIAPLAEGGRIAIRSTLYEGRLRIVVENSGRQGGKNCNLNAHGIGVSNTAERLRTLYGESHTFSLDWPESGGCEVTVELPFRSSAAPREVLSCAP
jgi:two-component system, LytTR family, sensor kinase